MDLRTQYSYQMMDPYFVGLIFSVYNSDPVTMVDTRDIIAFQAVADTEVRTLASLSVNSNAFSNETYQNCFICRPSDSTVSEDAGIEAKVATVLGSIPASSDTVESEGRQMKQC